MHTFTLVLVRPDTSDIHAACTLLMEPHRIDWDAEGKTWRFDYRARGHGRIADADTATALGLTNDADFADNVCFVSRLPPDLVPGAIITPDGRWRDFGDFDWRLRQRGLPRHSDPDAAWAAKVREVFAEHADCIAVEFDTHS